MRTLDFLCNVCATKVRGCPIAQIDRDVPSCPTCQSSVRSRSVVHLLSLVLFGKSMPLPDFPRDKSIVGLGLSDWEGFAVPLARKLGYTNTFFHTEPFLDIGADIPPARLGTCDFVISSDVFEHLLPPIERALVNTRALLKPNGTLILTMPFKIGGATDEHYPAMRDFRVVQFGEQSLIVAKNADGRFTLHENPIFHGGPGTTLEMRLLEGSDLLARLSAAGFDAKVIGESVEPFGILFYGNAWSLPILARKTRR